MYFKILILISQDPEFFPNQELEPSSGRHRGTRTTRWKVKNLSSCWFFINIGTRGLYFWSETTVDQQSVWTSTTHWLNSNKLRIGIYTKKRTQYNYCGIEDRKSREFSLGIKPTTLGSTFFSSKWLFWPHSSAIPAPWYSGWVVECMHRDLVGALLETCREPDLYPVHNSPKQQRLIA